MEVVKEKSYTYKCFSKKKVERIPGLKKGGGESEWVDGKGWRPEAEKP